MNCINNYFKLVIFIIIFSTAFNATASNTPPPNNPEQDSKRNILVENENIISSSKDFAHIIYRNEEALSYSMPVSRQLRRIDNLLAKGVKNTSFYSLTNGTKVIHYVDNTTLYFITPTETELQKDFQPDIEFKYVSTPGDKSSKCFKYLGWGGDMNNPVWKNERIKTTWEPYGNCSYHPFIFKGETIQGEEFEVYYIMAMSGAPVPYNYSTNPNSVAEISLDNMQQYGVINKENPLRIKIHGDWNNISDLSIRNIIKGTGTNIASKFAFDEDNKTYTIESDALQNSNILLNLYGTITYNTNNKKNKALKDTAGYEIYAYKGECSVEGTVQTEDMNHKIFALLSCSLKNESDKTFYITQRKLLDSDMFVFQNIPKNAKCTVKSWNLIEPVKNIQTKYICSKQ